MIIMISFCRVKKVLHKLEGSGNMKMGKGYDNGKKTYEGRVGLGIQRANVDI